MTESGPDSSTGNGDLHTRAAATTAVLPAGTRVQDRYRIQHCLGRGGFAVVYAAVDELLDERVALKIFHRELSLDRRQLLRFKREIRLSHRISDSRVVRVYSLDRWQDHWFLVMERVEGETLQQRLDRQGRISWEEFRPLFLEILAGLAALHSRRIVHRDIKPSNVMLLKDGGIKLLDFGLAKELGDTERSISIGEVVGTPRYLSPEQLRGGEVDVRSDVFQLGLLLQTVLAGTPPLQGLDTLSVLAQRMSRTPVRLQLKGVRLPIRVRAGLERALRKRPGSRFRDAAAMRRFYAASSGIAALRVRLRRLAPPLAALLLLAAAAWWLMSPRGGAAPEAVRTEGGKLKALDARGSLLWQKDFSPHAVYRAALQRCRPPFRPFRTNVPVDRLLLVFLASTPTLDAVTQPSLGSTTGDGRLLQLLPDGRTMTDQPLSALIRAGDYGFISRAFVEYYSEKDLDGDGSVEIIARVVHGRGMFPSALLCFSGGKGFMVVSPGHIGDCTIVPQGDGGWDLTLNSVNNRMCHLALFARLTVHSNVHGGDTVRLIPNLDPKWSGNAHPFSFLVFLPRSAGIDKKSGLPSTGPIRLSDQSGRVFHVLDNGFIQVAGPGGEREFRDSRQRLHAVYRDIQYALQARDLRNDLRDSESRLERAAAAGVQNPWLRSAIACFRGDVEVRRSRYAAGRRHLREALRLYPQNVDAAQRLCETAFLVEGPRSALRLLETEFPGMRNFWGLASGRDFFRALCLLQAGDFSTVRLLCNRLEQDDSRNADLVRTLLDLLSGRDVAAAIPGDNGAMSLLYTWEEYRLLEGRARLLAGDDSGRGEYCFRDVKEHSSLRRHLARMSLAWYTLRAGRSREAGLAARRAFTDLASRARGDLETRFWWFYDAWVYGRIMEELGEAREAERGYRACVAANPHSALAVRARRRLKKNSGPE